MEIHNEKIIQVVWHKLYPRHTYEEAKEKIKQLDKREIFKAYCDFCGFRINDKFIDTIEEIFKINLSKPDMREKIREYIDELNTEIKRCEKCIIDNGDDAPDTNNMIMVRIQTLQEVIYALEGRMEEVI